jgi:hypothetical protein
LGTVVEGSGIAEGDLAEGEEAVADSVEAGVVEEEVGRWALQTSLL